MTDCQEVEGETYLVSVGEGGGEGWGIDCRGRYYLVWVCGERGEDTVGDQVSRSRGRDISCECGGRGIISDQLSRS